MSITHPKTELREDLRAGRQYGLVDVDSRFHIFRADSFPPAFECGLLSPYDLVDFYPLGGVTCVNCITIVSMNAVADELNERVESVHERVACPRCGAVIGKRCTRVGARALSAPPLKHSHVQRLQADGIYLR